MAATFIVESGSGVSNANSYLSVADADTYHSIHSASTAWNGAENAAKEAALRLATQYLDVKYDTRYRGIKTNVQQALCWPRLIGGYLTNIYYGRDDYYYAPNVIPQRLKDACAELALKVIQGDMLFVDLVNPGDIKSETKKIGPLEKSVTYIGGKGLVKKYPLVEGLLKPLLSGSDTQMSRG
jgi:hypothetical protein